MKKINLLDCTLRDGGYYNNWDFSSDLINDYLKSLSLVGIKYVELGFRSKILNNYSGPCAYTKDSFIKSLKIPKNLKIGIMINASEIVSSKMNFKEFKNFVFDSNKSKISFIRFACHFNEIEKILPYINFLKKRKVLLILNLMQISQKSNEEIEEITKKISKSSVDVLYFADSMGSLNPDRMESIIKSIKKFWKKEIGFHAHDNIGKALINAETSIDLGVKWIDSTIMGMGRGPGNVKTEYALIQFNKYLNSKLNLSPILNLIENKFKKLKQIYDWGPNVYYFLSGLYGIHPTFIQSMQHDLNLKPDEMLSVIENLKKNKATKYNKNLIEIGKQIYKGKTRGEWCPLKKIRRREVLILGSGPSSKKHSKAIERFIKLKKPFVMALNDEKSINENLIDIRVACHTLRIATSEIKLKKISQPLVIPFKRLSNEQKNYFKNKKILDYGLEVKDNSFIFRENHAILPNSLTICYALAIANSGKSKKIYVTGLDGYPVTDPRRAEMDEIFKLYYSQKNLSDIISITPTRYKIKSSSVYGY